MLGGEDSKDGGPSFLTIVLCWLAMCGAIMSGSAIGPMFKYMQRNDIPPFLAASWRCQCMSVFLVPIAIVESKCSRTAVDWLAKKKDLFFPLFVHILLAGLFWSCNLLCWVEGLKFTTAVRASVFANAHPLILVVVLKLLGHEISLLEWSGIAVVVTGLLICSSTGLLQQSHGGPTTLVGDFLCLLAAVGEVFVMLNRAKTKVYVPLMQYTALTTLTVVVVSTILALMFEVNDLGSIHVFCLEHNCVFGWMDSNWLIVMLIFGLTVGVLCIAGFNFAVQYISPLVFSSVILVDPAVTGLISWAVGIEGVPDVPTIIGGIVVVAGVVCVSIGEKQRTDHKTPIQKLGSGSLSDESGLELESMALDQKPSASDSAQTSPMTTATTVERLKQWFNGRETAANYVQVSRIADDDHASSSAISNSDDNPSDVARVRAVSV